MKRIWIGMASLVLALGAPMGVAAGGGESEDPALMSSDLGSRLRPGVPVHVFHGLDDNTAPPAHADLYARAIPLAHLHLLPGRDHQLGNDLAHVARAIRSR